MTPSNPTNGQPLIYRIMDAFGVSHLVACINHTHEQSEVEGLPAALNSKAPLNHEHTSIGEDTDESYADVTASEGMVHIEVRNQSRGGECDIRPSNIGNLNRALDTPDATPTADSDKLVTSGGVKAALEGKQNTLTFDSTPTAESTNPVTSGGVKAALDGKQDTLTFDAEPTLYSTNPVTSSGVKVAIEEKFQGIVPDIIGDGGSMNLDILGMTPHSVRRFIIQNTGSSAIPFRDMFYSENLPVHISGDDTLEIGVGEYVMVSVFRENSSEHVHFNCYFVLFEGIFSE